MSAPASGLSVVRICSVFEPPVDLRLEAVSRFDPIGGMQNHTAELSRGLDRLGIRQTVVSTRPPGAPAVQRIGSHSRLLRFGLPVARFRQLYAVPALPAVLRAGADADLVHIHLGEDLAIVPLGLAAARLDRVPIVLTIHCSLRHTFGGPGVRGVVMRTLGAWLEEVGVARAAAVIVLTPRMAQLVEPRVRRGRLHVVPPGVNPDVFRGPFDDPLPHVPRPRVVFLGRLAPQKDPLRLITAVPFLPPDARVVLVGDGPQRATVEEEARRLGVADRVVVTGFVHHALVPAYLAHADVLVLPSMYEELGTALLEAMFLGVPVVGTRRGGIPEVIRDGENGLLVEAGDARALAAAVERILRDDGVRATLSENARAWARRHDWHLLSEEVLGIYRDVISSRPPGRVPRRTPRAA